MAEQQFVFQTETGEPIDPASLGLSPEELASLIAQATAAHEDGSQGSETIEYVDPEQMTLVDPQQMTLADPQSATHDQFSSQAIQPEAAETVDHTAQLLAGGDNTATEQSAVFSDPPVSSGEPSAEIVPGTQFVDEHGNPIENPQFVDEHGNPVSLEQLAAQGVLLDGSDSLEGAEIIQLQEGQQIVQTEDGEMFIVQEDGTASQLTSMTDASASQTSATSEPPNSGDADTAGVDAAPEQPSLMEVDLNVSTGSAPAVDKGPDMRSKGYAAVDSTPFFDPSVVKAPTKTNRGSPFFDRGAISKSTVKDLNLKCQCPHCGRGFAAEHHLKRHIDLAHVIKKSFFCPPCNKNLSFMTSSHFEAHLRMAHNITKPYPWEKQPPAEPVASPVKPPPRPTEYSPPTMDLTPADQHEGEPPSIELQQTPQRLQSQKEAAAAISAEAAALGAVGDDTVYQCGACGSQFKETETLVAHISAQHMEDVNDAPMPAVELPPPQQPPIIVPPSLADNNRLTRPSEPALAKPSVKTHFGIGNSQAMPNVAVPAPFTQTNAAAPIGKAKDFEFYRCKFCQREFLSLSGLKKHIKDHPLSEEEKRNLAAELPATEGDEDLGLDAPMYASSSTGKNARGRQPQGGVPKATGFDHLPYKCDVCQHRFGTKDGFEAHSKTHSSGTGLKCDHCSRKFSTTALLQDHQRVSHPDRLSCELCAKNFTSDNRLEDHMRTHADAPPTREHQCTICERAFYERDSLAKHLREHREHVFDCEECDKKFVSKQLLDRHMFVHIGRKDHLCSICGKVFSRRENLKAHRYLHSGEKPLKCDVCGAGFTTKWSLKNHSKMHSMEKTFMCEHCGRTFNHKHNLDLHVRVHQNLRPFQCSSCSKTFNRLEHLQTHINDHERIRPYPCTRCDRAFFSSAHLNQHLRVHNGEQPFQCGSCEKSFMTKSRLQKHVKTHTKNDDAQYVVIWEKAGVVQEAVIVTDGLSTATGPLVAAAPANAPQVTSRGVESHPLQPAVSMPLADGHAPSSSQIGTSSAVVAGGTAGMSNNGTSHPGRLGPPGVASGYQPILPHPASIQPVMQHNPTLTTFAGQNMMVATANVGSMGTFQGGLMASSGAFQQGSEQLGHASYIDSKQVMPSQSMTLNVVGAGTNVVTGQPGMMGLPPGMMDGQSVQFIDVHGNPIENFDGSEQFVVLDESQLAQSQGTGGTILQTSDGQTTIIDRNTLLALTGSHQMASGTAGAGNEDTIYVTEEEFQNLTAQQRVLQYP